MDNVAVFYHGRGVNHVFSSLKYTCFVDINEPNSVYLCETEKLLSFHNSSSVSGCGASLVCDCPSKITSVTLFECGVYVFVVATPLYSIFVYRSGINDAGDLCYRYAGIWLMYLQSCVKNVDCDNASLSKMDLAVSALYFIAQNDIMMVCHTNNSFESY